MTEPQTSAPIQQHSGTPTKANAPRPTPPASRSTLLALRPHLGLFLALLVYLGLAFAYFFIIPIFEGPDEWTHTGHIKYIAEGNGLPVMLPGQGIWGGQQPPLYYAVAALLVQPFDLDGVEEYEETRRNPHAAIGYALDPGNKNNYLHQPTEAFPYRGLSLTVHVLRLYSMIYGLIALIFIYLTAFEIYESATSVASRKWQVASGKSQVASRKSQIANHHSPFTIHYSLFTIHNSQLFAAAVALVVATQPMFAFITASVANEPANIAFCAVGLWLVQRYVLRGPSESWHRPAALGITLGLISLSKMTGLSFGLVAVIAILITAFSRRKQPGAARLLWRDGLIIGLLFVAVGGWWYWRNYQLYGDFFQQGLYKIYFNVDPAPLTLSDFLYTLSTGEVSFWATFGWLNIAAPEWVYRLYRIVSRIGLIGVGLAGLLWLLQRIRYRQSAPDRPEKPDHYPLFAIRYSSFPFPSALILHLLFPVILAFSLTRLVAIEGGLQGRQLLPALGSIAIVIIWGWWTLSPPRWRLPVTTILLAGLLAVAVWLPYGVVAPAYIPPSPLAEAELPADLARLDWSYNDDIRLLGVKIGTEVSRPGERIPVTAYWQALRPMTTNYSVFVHLIGRGYTNIGQLNSYPGLGLRPTSTLQPGQIIVDTYPVQVNGGAAAPTRLLVNLGLFDFNQPGRPGLPPITSAGEPVHSPTVGQLKLIPTNWPAAHPGPPLADFADNISLNSVSIEDCQTQASTCRITFEWLARGRPATDYTVFIQLWQADNSVAGFDAPPLANDYPTGLWDANEVIIDPHTLDLTAVPPGSYRILAGLYNFTTGDRLPASQNGVPLPNFAVELDEIELN